MSIFALADDGQPLSEQYTPIDSNDGYATLREGLRLFQLEEFRDAAPFFWRAVLLYDNDPKNAGLYSVDEAFLPFLKCYMKIDALTDGLLFIAAESYLRGQDEMGDTYLTQTLERDANNHYGLELKKIISDIRRSNIGGGAAIDGADMSSGNVPNALRLAKIKEIRDRVDINNPVNKKSHLAKHQTVKTADDFWSQFTVEGSTSSEDLADHSPEELFNLATTHFNAGNVILAEERFEQSCVKSDYKLSVACTTAVYIRTNLCMWGRKGEGFDNDMKIIAQVTQAEAKMYRSIERKPNSDQIRDAGLGYHALHNGGGRSIIYWQRGTSVHPHMMLGYPLPIEQSILKRYAAESMASLDERRARFTDNGVAERPLDLPYDVNAMREKFVEEHRKQLARGVSGPIKVGFVACSFNSKAVLYLSHDMFRFFDPEVVEIHVFSLGQPDNPLFIKNTMRGVDWRQRVIDTVDHFHDVRQFRNDHIGLARYIHSNSIQVLIEWDGYARQGERAAGLMALRPSPVQILHQEFLMTSGAQYIDYIVTDKTVSPLQLEELYTEKFIYLPHHFFSKGHAVQDELSPPSHEYVPRQAQTEFQLGVGTPQQNSCLSPNPLGASGSGEEVSFVYCNFNKFLKNNPQTVRSWLRILEEVPNSILCLLEFPVEAIPNLREFILDSAENKSISDRIHFISWEKNPFDHQARSFSLCNVMLDSHPYNGHTTAQDALYAGVPIVTRSDGKDMASRVSTSANAVLGLEALNAVGGASEYEDIAIRLGTDSAWFRSIRGKLIDTCLSLPMHPYWDVPRYVRNFQTGLLLAWHNFISGKPAEHIEVVEKSSERGGSTRATLDELDKTRRIFLGGGEL